jgi:hypothetical protein
MGRTEFPDLKRLRASLGWYGTYFYESEMALFSECMQYCARKVLDTADIVRDACLRHPRL